MNNRESDPDRLQEARRPDEELSCLLLEQSPVAIAFFDRDFCYLRATQRWLAELEITDEVRGKPYYAVLPDAPSHLENVHRNCLTGKTQTVAAEMWSFPGGVEKWVTWKMEPWRDRAGEIGGSMLYLEAIASHPQIPADSPQLLQSIIDNLPQFIFWKDRNLVYRGCNQNFATVAGLKTPAEIVGKTDYDLPWKREEADWFRECDRRIMNEDKPEYNIVEPQLQANGQQRWLSTSKIPLRDDGEIVGILGTYEDITDRKQTEDQLKLIQFSLDRAGDAVFLVKADAQLVYVNESACSSLGYSRAELLQLKVFDFAPEFPAEVWPEFWQNVQQQKTLTVENTHKTKEGDLFPVELNLNYLEFNGEEYNCAIVRDITERKQAEAQIQKLVAVLENSSDFIGLADLEGCPIFINRAGLEMVGLNSLEEAKTKLVPEFYPPENREYSERVILQTAIEQGYWKGEFNFRNFVTDEAISVDFHLFTIADATTGEPLAIATITRDIRDRKQAEKEQARLLKILETTTDFVGIVDATGQGVYLNKAGRSMVGMGKDEEIASFSMFDFVLPSEQEIIASDRLPQVIRDKIWQGEASLLHQDGSTIPVSQVLMAHYAESGEVEYISTIARDIRDRKAVEDQLRETQTRFQAILDYAPAAIYIKSLAGQYLVVNRRFQEVLGVELEAILGSTDYDILPKEVADRIRENDCAVIEKQTALQAEETIPQADGLQTFLSVKFPLLDVEGEPYAVCGISTDISDRKAAEEALRRSEERNQAFLAAIPDMMFQTNAEGVYLDIIAAKGEELLIEREKILGQKLGDILPPDLAEQALAHTQQAIATKEPQTFEYQLAFDEQIQDYEARIVASGDDTAFAIVRNISDRKRAEEALRASQQRLSIIFAQTSVAVIEWDLDRKVTAWNAAAESIFGYSTREAIGQHASFIVSEEIRGYVDDIFEELFAQIGGTHSINDNVTKKGKTIICEWHNTPLIDENGNCIGMASLAFDISDRKRAEEALRTSQQKLSILFEQTSVALVEWNLDFEVVAWNTAAETIFGYSVSEAIGHHAAGLIVPENVREYVDKIMKELIAQTGGTQSINENLTKDGRRIICEWYNTPLVDENGECIGVASLALDITERQRSEKELRQSEERFKQKARELEQILRELRKTQAQLVQTEKMSSLGQLVAGVAHEINNPVNFIYGNVSHANDYLRDLLGLLELYQREYPRPTPALEDRIEEIDLDFLVVDLPKIIASMKVGAERIRTIVASLRNFSRMDEADMKAVDIHEGIDSTLMILQNRLKVKSDRPEIQVIKHYGNLPKVECYAGQLNQVFMNILANAIDALEERDKQRSREEMAAVPSTIEISTAIASDSLVTIRIADNGPGMPESVQQRLFDPFFTTKAVGKGTGLGLSISYQIVTDKHGGTLTCHSQQDGGTEFAIAIPQCQRC